METLRTVLSRAVAFALVLFAVGGSMAWADSQSACFTYIVFPPGSFPGFPGDIAGAADGQTIRMAGAGPLCVQPKSVGGGGTFTHKNAAGAVVATGTWTAVELLSFSDYGTAVPFFPPNVHGGLAIMRVHLTPSTGGAGFDGVLEVDCAINQPGEKPPDFTHGAPLDLGEGIRLAVEGGPNFNIKISSATVFLAI